MTKTYAEPQRQKVPESQRSAQVPMNQARPLQPVNDVTMALNPRVGHHFGSLIRRAQRADGQGMSQWKRDMPSAIHQQVASPKNLPNDTGLPDSLKAGVEALSGVSLWGVKVHYNSPKPAQLSALAYTQGSEIHVAPGQEHHLPHEAWHVVQQRQGRVRGTTQMKGVALNDEAALEFEADLMGGRAARYCNGCSLGSGRGTEDVPLVSDTQLEERGLKGSVDNRASACLQETVQLYGVVGQFRNLNQLQEHWEKHVQRQRDAGGNYADAAAYEAAAMAVVDDPTSESKMNNRKTYYYLARTGQFVSVSADGYISTMFVPGDGLNYYLRQ